MIRRRRRRRRRRGQGLVDGPRRQVDCREPLRCRLHGGREGGSGSGGGGGGGQRERRRVQLLLPLLPWLLSLFPSRFFLHLLPLGRRPPQRQQLRRPRVQRVLEPLDPAVVELDLLPEAGELAVALGEAGGQLLVCFFFPKKSEFFFFFFPSSTFLRACGLESKKNSQKILSPRS